MSDFVHPGQLTEARQALDRLRANMRLTIRGKDDVIDQVLVCLVAGGHLLIEDLPGMGKTTLAEALARGFGLSFKRVSFTSDLLPADLTGINVFDAANTRFHFQPGPLFSQVLLADEINRASPRTQSALLEAMAAGRVSVDGVSHPLPQPFLVIATQNGIDQVGTAPLPESQLDRFLMRLSLGFPNREAERDLLSGQALPPAQLEPLFDAAGLLELQRQTAAQHCSNALLDYVLDLAAFSRRADQPGPGLSPRACQGLVAAARAWSLLEGRDHVTPADVQAVLPAVADHRLQRDAAALLAGVDGLR